jgi:hypothetical protein
MRTVMQDCVTFVCICGISHGATFEFEPGANHDLFNNPYSENGYVVTEFARSTTVCDGPAADGVLSLRTFTNLSPNLRWAASDNSLFDRGSLDVQAFNVGGTFTVLGSSGSTHVLTSTGVVDFTSLPGTWTGLTHFDISYAGASSSETLDIDDVVIVPEALSAWFLAIGAGVLSGRRRPRSLPALCPGARAERGPRTSQETAVG